jgi:glutathione S-transferase
VSDSARIADYLDAAYPDTPKLSPAGTHALQKSFCVAYDHVTRLLLYYIVYAVVGILRPRSEEYFTRTREASFGKKLEDVAPTGAAHDAAWKELEDGFGRVKGWIGDGDFVMGDTVSFADFVIAGELQWCLKAWGEEDKKWKDLMAWHDGRWAKLFNDLKKYEGPAEEMHD